MHAVIALRVGYRLYFIAYMCFSYVYCCVLSAVKINGSSRLVA